MKSIAVTEGSLEIMLLVTLWPTHMLLNVLITYVWITSFATIFMLNEV